MKKVLFPVILSLVGMLTLSNTLNAQSSSFDNPTFVKSLNTMSNDDKIALESIKLTNERMYKDFTKRFKDASGIHVNQTGGWHFISCYTNGDLNRSMYNKSGRWQHTITTYDNSKLPASVREHIEYVYPHFEIFGGVVEVKAQNGKAYLVTIENKKEWKRIKVVGDESEVYEQYVKK